MKRKRNAEKNMSWESTSEGCKGLKGLDLKLASSDTSSFEVTYSKKLFDIIDCLVSLWLEELGIHKCPYLKYQN